MSDKVLEILSNPERYECFADGISEFHNGELVLYEDYAFLRARHTALVEAVAWERECDGILWPIYGTDAYFEVYNTKVAARAEVDRLIEEGE